MNCDSYRGAKKKYTYRIGSNTYTSSRKINDADGLIYIVYKLDNEKKTRKHANNEKYIYRSASYGPNAEYQNYLGGSVNKLTELHGVMPPNGYYNTKNIEHLTFGLCDHGDADSRAYQSGILDPYQLNKMNIISDNLNAIKDSDFNKMKSFYFKSYSCHGAYHDTHTNIFDEIQAKLKRCQSEAPKCFVSLLKPEYEMILGYNCDKNQNVIGMRRTPTKDNIDIIDDQGTHVDARTDVHKFDLDEIEKNKDKYFDYYYVTKDKIYKVPHEFVHNRVRLIDDGKFNNVLDKAIKGQFRNIDINEDVCPEKDEKKYGIVDKKREFKEFYDYKRKKEQEKNRLLNSLRNAAPKELKNFY